MVEDCLSSIADVRYEVIPNWYWDLLESACIWVWTFTATGLFHSIMWTVIFDLALKDVDPANVKLGSGILCTGVVFTGLWTWIMGVIA